jgi:hypothetical protein
MRYVKTFALLSVVLGIASAFAGTASATTITSSEGQTPWITMYSENHTEIHNAIVNIKCNTEIEGTVESHGTGVTASGAVSKLSLTSCTDEWKVVTVHKGSFIIHATGEGSGIFTLTDTTIEATRAGLNCQYKTNLFGTTVGTLTPNSGWSGATLDVASTWSRHGGSFLCGSANAAWTGSFKVVPSTLSVDK